MNVGIVFSQADSGTDPAAIRAWARRAEEAGFAHIMAYDHLLGASVERLGPGPFGPFPSAPYTVEHTFHEVLTLFSHLAAATSTIGFVTSILVLPQRQTAFVAKQVATVTELVSDAVSRGATVAVGGVAPGGPGNFYPATVLTDVPADARILKEEVFGPVAPITGFDTEDEGVAAANNTEYGLAAYVYTQSLDRALRVAEGIESGMVGVNRGVISDAAAPFGGVKESGFGREGGSEGIEEYLDTKYIALTK